MIDVNSMLEMVESEVWLHGDVNSMVVAMELGGVVEGGLKLELDASKGGETQMVRSTHAAYFNIKLVRQQMVRSRSEVCTNVLEHKIRSIRERGLLYGTYVEKRTCTKAHSTVRKSTKSYMYKKKNPP